MIINKKELKTKEGANIMSTFPNLGGLLTKAIIILGRVGSAKKLAAHNGKFQQPMRLQI